MKMKTRFRCFIVLFILGIMLAGLVPMGTQAASRKWDFKVSMKKEDSVKLHLKEENVSKYVIYRAAAKADGTRAGAYKKQITLFGTNITYIDEMEPGQYYFYRVYGYAKKNDTYQKICEAERLVYSGWRTMWHEYQHCDANVTPFSIPLRVYAEEDFLPEGYIIYRKEAGETYKKLAVIKSRKNAAEYLDEAVEAGKTYLYRARAYRFVNGKKIFGVYTDAVRLCAANKIGRYHYEMLTSANEKTSELLMKLVSDTNNGELLLIGGTHGATLEYVSEDDQGEEIEVALKFTEYSYDNKNWFPVTEEKEQMVVIKGGERIYLRFEARKDEKFTYLGVSDHADLVYRTISYNDLTSCLEFEAENGIATAAVMEEYYH